MAKRNFDELTIRPVAKISTPFKTKFGIPKQSELVSSLKGKIVFNKEFRKEGILKGIEGFSHLYLIWGFSGFDEDTWSPTVRPPRLGGNERVGVFASRSPNRPNPLALSIVKLQRIEMDKKDGPVLYVSGVDMMDGTPIYDIKPYIPLYDSVPEAKSGFVSEVEKKHLKVEIPPGLVTDFSQEQVEELKAVLSEDPHPSYRHDERKYGFVFNGYEIKFRIVDGTAEVFYIQKDPEEK
jgi:tRNA-Thr(GGU) m(6)t(6)A37 methyltransferase TsaA